MDKNFSFRRIQFWLEKPPVASDFGPWPRVFFKLLSFSIIFETVGEYTFLSRSRWAVSNSPVRRGIDPLTSRPNWGPDHSAKPSSERAPERRLFFEPFTKKNFFRPESVPTGDQTSLLILFCQKDFSTRVSSAINSVTCTVIDGSSRNSSDSETRISQIL